MNRRDFLKGGLALSTFLGTTPRLHSAFPSNSNKTIAHLMLNGGPDFRHLIMPVPDNEYGIAFWQARSSVFSLSPESTSSHFNYFNENYDLVNLGNTRLGVLKKAGWLKNQIQSGNVAIINNVVGAQTRDHSHCQIAWQAADQDSSRSAEGRDGWGGRLSRYTNKKVLSVTSRVGLFCNGPSPRAGDHDNSHVLSFANFERAGFAFQDSWGERDSRRALFQSIRNYYSARRTLSNSNRTQSLLSIETILRDNSEAIQGRLKDEIEPRGGFEASTSGGNNSNNFRRPNAFDQYLRGEGPRLHSTGFLRQCLNSYYAMASQDILDFNTISMEYGGWDSHRDQLRVENALEDIFGENGGLATLWNTLAQDMPLALENLVFMIGGEFGRQLLSNGDEGTDHGRGNHVLLIGKAVQSGSYGEMWRASEIERMRVRNADIEGLTSLERVVAQLSDWIAPDLGRQVVPNASNRILEDSSVLNFISPANA